MIKIRRAILSVSDKSGLAELAQCLHRYGVEVIASGGTAKFLNANNLPAIPVEEITGFPEILGGRVKTLHPALLGGILARKDDPSHLRELEKHKIPAVDLVVVNLYPFRDTIAKPDTTLEEAIEQIDVGGVTLIRAAAKNFHSVAIVTQPDQYDVLIAELEQNAGGVSLDLRRRLARQAFSYTASYDQMISSHLQKLEPDSDFPELINFSFEKQQDLRYGENPHQRAALYRDLIGASSGLMRAEQLQGKELSYNNLVDAETAWGIACSFEAPCCAIVKHANPCGVAQGEDGLSAYERALATDPVSAFGGIVGLNTEVTAATAEAITRQFVEVIIAPSFSSEARAVFAGKKNVRLLRCDLPAQGSVPPKDFDLVRLTGGLLMQERDLEPDDESQFRVVTERQPAAEEWQALKFGWRVVKWVKSNAVIFCSSDRTLGIGAGQMSRVDSSFLATEKAKKAGISLAGSVVASDAFFPFADGVETAARAGAKAVIQPGGSRRDAEVIAAANRFDMAMVMTGRRHFRH